MLEAKKFPIYQKIRKERDQYADLVHNDVINLGIVYRHLSINDEVAKHFNRLHKVNNPNASRRYVIANARMNMLEFAVKDLNQGHDVREALDKIHDIEYLDKRDHINLAKREARYLAEQDQSILTTQEVKY